MEPSNQAWVVAVGVAAGGVGGLFAHPWKRRNSIAWSIYGAVTCGAALILLALLPRLERRSLPANRERNWHH